MCGRASRWQRELTGERGKRAARVARVGASAYRSVIEFNHSMAWIKIAPWQGFGKHQQIRVRSPCLANLARRFSSAYTSPCSKMRSHNHRR
jgi:hypothetical protein